MQGNQTTPEFGKTLTSFKYLDFNPTNLFLHFLQIAYQHDPYGHHHIGYATFHTRCAILHNGYAS